jgi:pimeloyl-ACP methyl ester carboxylesterase
MSATPVVFIHGLWIHSSAWQPWIDLFAEKGYSPSAPGWPGDADTVQTTRANAENLDDVGIEQICHHYADFIDTLETKPIVIGHSFGGLIAQELLANDLAVAGVAIDPAPIKGVKKLPFSQLRSGFPVLGNPANKHRTVSLTAKQFRYSFGNALSEEESDQLHAAWTIPGPGRPLFEDAAATFSRNSPASVDTHKAPRGPLLLISGTEDHTVPKAVTLEVFEMYGENPDAVTEYREIAGRGHSLTMDNGWRDVADVTLEWLAAQKLEPSAASSAESSDSVA